MLMVWQSQISAVGWLKYLLLSHAFIDTGLSNLQILKNRNGIQQVRISVTACGSTMLCLSVTFTCTHCCIGQGYNLCCAAGWWKKKRFKVFKQLTTGSIKTMAYPSWRIVWGDALLEAQELPRSIGSQQDIAVWSWRSPTEEKHL